MNELATTGFCVHPLSGLALEDQLSPEIVSTAHREATLRLDQCARFDWDVIVIGAGPAGSLAARQLARSGASTLRVDKSAFPRDKVCGGCISGLGMRLLKELKLDHLAAEPAAVPLRRLEIAAEQKRVSLELSAGAAVSRRDFDAALVNEAVSAGAEFLPETTALVRGLRGGRQRCVKLQEKTVRSACARGRLVLVADGLQSTSLKCRSLCLQRIAAVSRIGLGATLDADQVDLPPGCVAMYVGRRGYVGLVRTPDGRVDLAAAVDPGVLRDRGPARAIASILDDAGLVESCVKRPAALERAHWRGTGLLTRRNRRVAARRVLLLGDASGYIEPFTGDGMTWAFLSAVRAAGLAEQWLRRDRILSAVRASERRRAIAELQRDWTQALRTSLARRRRGCGALAGLLRHPAAVRAAMRLISLAPAAARPLVDHFWDPGRLEPRDFQ